MNFFTHTIKQILSSRLQITNMEGSETFMAQTRGFTPRCAFCGIVDDSHAYGSKFPQNRFLGPEWQLQGKRPKNSKPFNLKITKSTMTIFTGCTTMKGPLWLVHDFE